MQDWQNTRNKAIDNYHMDLVEDALNQFDELISTAESTTKQIDVQIWRACCLDRLGKAAEAKEEINQVLERVEHSTQSQNRALRLLANIHVSLYEFEEALHIYKDLIEETTNYDDLFYLEHLVEDALTAQANFETYGTVQSWKHQLIEKIDAV